MYNNLTKNKTKYSLEIPKTFVPSPTDTDYSNGFIQRYFVQRVSDVNGFVFEIDLDTHQSLLTNPYFISTILRWRITGPINETFKIDGSVDDKGVILSNKASIGIAASTLKNIGLYLTNPLQFYK
jgi:hypothetical protein